ncbi:HK97 family phage portal protein [Candidatus Xenohaliotis californiensis]|uniref:HK97 family phage portal protein n=1 Tax=Candidatus Xenohaliotis californiensis TaxID=84677 RepID=A0ABP0ETW8_9RICK|nr:HK97 family phage portal protein [Candidatus Xenohaliotis californiensis]
MFKKLIKKYTPTNNNRYKIRNWHTDNYIEYNYDYNRLALNGYAKNVVAFRAVKMIATSISSIEIVINKKIGINTKNIINHPVLKILKNPNNLLSGMDFIENLVSHMLIGGGAYILKIGLDDKNPVELHLLHPNNTVTLVKNDEIIGYEYHYNKKCMNYYINNDNGDCDVLHIKSFHPTNDTAGLSSMNVAMTSINQYQYATEWNCSLLKNSARPSGALIVKNKFNDTLTEEQFDRIKEQISDLYSGSSNSGRPVLLEGGLEWKEMSVSPKEMDFVEIKNSAARDIALSFGVPPQMLGIPGDNTYSNLIEARLALWEQTILPLTDKILNGLSRWLLNDKNLMFSYNKDKISALSPRREKLWSYINNASFMSNQEKREALGLDSKLDE